VKHVFVHHPLESIHPVANQAAQVASCAGKQGASAFWAMHELLFERASEWSGAEDALEEYGEYGAELGLDTAALLSCIESQEMAPEVQRQLELGLSTGVSGVPAFFVNDWFVSGAQDYAVFEQVIESALRGEHPPPTPTPLPEGATAFDVNPDAPARTYGGDVTIGSVDAEILLLEFLDLASEPTAGYVSEVWPGLVSDYVDAATVRVLVKYFPASENVAAITAAQATECAANQDAFLLMHDKLFADRTWIEAGDVSAALQGYAAELGLDIDAFTTCLSEEQTAEKVDQDVLIAQRNQLQPAPQFVIFYAGQAGIVPLDELRSVLDQLLAE
jgi:protein-disulfide isomerase